MTSSEILEILLENKERQCKQKIKNKQIIKIIYTTISISTILIQSIMGSSLISSSGYQYFVNYQCKIIWNNYKFKFQNKIQLIERLTKIQNKVQYVNSCNGNLTEQEYIEIFK